MSTSTSNRSSQVKGSGDTFSWRRSRELMLSVSEEEKSPLISSTSTSWCDQHASESRADRSINASNSWILSTSVDYSYKHQQQQPPCEYKNQPTSIRELVCLGFFIFVAVFLFSIPIILRYVPFQMPNNSTTNYSNCSSHDDWVVSRSMSGCDAAVYTNSGVCYHQLSNWQQCALGETTTTVSVDMNGTSVSSRETKASMYISMIHAKASTECKRAAIPFVCQLIFPLCDNSTGMLVRPSKQACQNLENGVCSTEMKQIPMTIPDCNKLPGNNNTAPSAPVNCSDNFYLLVNRSINRSTCQPSCTRFKQFSDVYIILNKVVVIMFGAVGLLASIIVILAFVMRCKSGPLFPSLYYVYCSIGHTVISVIFIVSAIEQGNLYCSSKSLYDSLDNPSTFCLISGAAVHYFLVNMMFWLVCYSLSIMFKVVLPIYSKRMEKPLRVAHIGVSILGWLVPLPAVVLALTNKDDGYIISFFPPLFCITRNMDVWFYSTMLVIDVLGVAHMSILVIIFCVVHKYQGILRPLEKRQIRISTVEKKLLFIFIYYVLAGTVALICFGLHTNQNIVKQYKQSLTSYFDCEVSGLHPQDVNRCEKSFAEIQKHSFPLLFTIMILFVSLAPVVYLTFLFNWNLFKSKMQALFVTASSGNSTTQPEHSGVPVL